MRSWSLLNQLSININTNNCFVIVFMINYQSMSERFTSILARRTMNNGGKTSSRINVKVHKWILTIDRNNTAGEGYSSHTWVLVLSPVKHFPASLCYELMIYDYQITVFLTPNINMHLWYMPRKMFDIFKYKEGNNRPSSVNQISLVHNHDKAGNKCYTQDNTDTDSGKNKRVNRW